MSVTYSERRNNNGMDVRMKEINRIRDNLERKLRLERD